jgi:histidinol-phosphate phosphatase family protein
MLPLNTIDKSWTLFLDRDGVINHEKDKDYIHTWDEFKFYEGVKKAFEIFSQKFKRIIIVTNQRGVGRGVTKEADLKIIHKNMQLEIVKNNGHVDAVYYCTDLDDNSPNRKPNAGMGLQAVKDFPDIDLTKALMVGNTLSDMNFGRNLGVYTVFLPTTLPDTDLNDPAIDASYPSLYAFAEALS